MSHAPKRKPRVFCDRFVPHNDKPWVCLRPYPWTFGLAKSTRHTTWSAAIAEALLTDDEAFARAAKKAQAAMAQRNTQPLGFR